MGYLLRLPVERPFTMPNAYANLGDLKGSLVAGISITTHDTRLREVLEGISRVVDEYLGRHIYSYTDTRYFRGNGQKIMTLPWDLIAVTTLTEDTTANATYDNTWATTDYILSGGSKEQPRYDISPTGRAYLETTRPYWIIEVDQRSTGSESNFARSQRRFELVGKFGFSESKRTPVSVAAEALTATETDFDVDAGTDFEIGQTLLVDTEQMYITAIASNTLTVERGVNGTTAATHLDNAVIDIIEYPTPVREAVLIETQLLLETRGYRRQLGNFETGIITPFGRTLSAETKTKLDPFIRVRV